MSAELVLSRRCRHIDWCKIPTTSTEFCKRCGFAMISAAGRPTIDVFNTVQVQPQAGASFAQVRRTPVGGHDHPYSPLNLAYKGHIRILVLKAGRPNDSLQCELEHVDLQQGPIYEALSYTWADATGDDSLCRKIECGDAHRSIPITKNCEAALLRLRKLNSVRRLWIDAVCIDQSHIQERNHQVKNMIAIFRNALRVLVYLGEGTPLLSRLLDYIVNDTAGQLPQIFDLISLFQSRWFHRVWVLQEIAVAKCVVMICGEKTIAWDNLVEHSNLFLRLMTARNLPSFLPPVMYYGLQQKLLGTGPLYGTSNLVSLLRASRNSSCKDARDKVYAILGLLHNKSDLLLSADYSLSVTAGWVYLQIAAWHVTMTKSVDMLSLVERTSKYEMPSWVPDWTHNSPATLPTQIEVLTMSRAPYIAYTREHLPSSPATSGYPLDCVLHLRGQRYATVWTDRRIFSEAPLASKRVSRAIASERGNRIATRPYSSDCGGHWLHDPLQNSWGMNCPKREKFWDRLLSAYGSTGQSKEGIPDYSSVDADIPPAFGGPCRKCYKWGIIHGYYQRRCCCTSVRQSSGHFEDEELDEFLLKMNQYCHGRQLFGTDHSLGFGPPDIQDWDEIWRLEGSNLPFILRRVEGMYKLIGACYIHEASRTTDRCFACSTVTIRKEITLHTEPIPRSTEWPNAREIAVAPHYRRPRGCRDSGVGESDYVPPVLSVYSTEPTDLSAWTTEFISRTSPNDESGAKDYNAFRSEELPLIGSLPSPLENIIIS